MDATLIGVTSMNGTRSWDAGIRDYARWEFGRDAEAWLLANTRRSRARRRRRPGLRARVRAWLRVAQSLPTTTAIADAENRFR